LQLTGLAHPLESIFHQGYLVVTFGNRVAVAETHDTSESSRLEKLRRLEELGVDPWGGRFDGHLPIGDVLKLPADNPEPERPKVRVAGRVVLRRVGGKVHWVDLWDWTTPLRDGERGKIQVMLGKNQIGAQGWDITQNLDLGDLVGVDGSFGKTKTGEPTVFADKITMLAKSLQPHPDKWGGMQDMEFRLRHRYLDLVYNPELLDRSLKRVKVLRAIRSYLDGLGFCEVETPTLHAIAGGAAARPFVTHHNALDIDLFLRIALELHLKRLLVGGIEKVYEIGRVFRNEGISPKHNPEFTMMELYQAYGDYRSMMDVTEGLIVASVKTVLGLPVDQLAAALTLPYGDKTIDFTPPFQRAVYADLFLQHVGVAMDDVAGVRQKAEDAKIPLALRDEKAGTSTTKEHDVLVHELFEHKVEHHLLGPVFVHDYPAKLCPLTKRKAGNPNIAERFELYINGMELANAYTELNDPITQETTFREQLAGLAEEDSMAKMDDDFVRALRHAMPPAGGLGVGIDRLVMLLTNTQTIRDVILFPLLRPH
jgi:lysyl-tRNA synthetase class 2